MDSNIGNMSGKPVRVPVTIKKANTAAYHTHTEKTPSITACSRSPARSEQV